MKTETKNNIFELMIFCFFLIISAIIFHGLFSSRGIIIGSDWSIPYTKNQINTMFERSFDTWYGLNLGSRNIGAASLYFFSLIKLFSSIGVSALLFQIVFLIFIFALAAFNMFTLLKYFKIKQFTAIFCGILYITTPLFFNYSVMGWQYVLITMAIFPLVIKYFIKSVKEKYFKDKIILGILIALSIQTQSIVWYFISFVCLFIYLVYDKKSLYKYLMTITIVIVLYITLNAYWLLGLLLYPDKGIVGSDILNSPGSLGTLGKFRPIEMIRLFGSLFDYQYESILVKSKIEFLYVVFPLAAFGSIFLIKNNKLIVSLSLIAVLPFFVFILNIFRDILFYIPFANVFRDFGRFISLSTFAYPILIAFTLDELFNSSNKKIIGYLLVILIGISIYPWWTFKITDLKEGLVIHQRLRTKEFPKEYLDVENSIANEKLDQKVLFLPIYGTVDYEDDIKFHGAAHETADIFAGYSKAPGVIVINDRALGFSDNYVKKIRDALNENSSKLEKYIQNTNIRYVIVRKNMLMQNKINVINNIESGDLFVKHYDSAKIVVFKRKDDKILQHFYIPDVEIFTSQELSKLPLIIAGVDKKAKSSIYFKANGKIIKSRKFDKEEIEIKLTNNQPEIEYKKISSTKYRVIVHNVRSPFTLIFSETFHEGWKVYQCSFKRKSMLFNENIYKISNKNDYDQASFEDLKKYINKGYISEIGDYKEKELKRANYNIDFISKDYNGVLQNDNLKNGQIYESWFKRALFTSTHTIANGYANSWRINPADLLEDKIDYTNNLDGSYNFEFIIEYWHQRIFYLGLFITLTALLASFAYLIFYYCKQRSILVTGERV